MALIKCKACGEKISENAVSCPHCGEPLPKKQSSLGTVIFIILIVGILGYVFFENEIAPTKYTVNTTTPKRTYENTCKNFIVLHQADHVAKVYGRSVKWLYATGKKIYLWEKPTHEGKGRKIGEMRIGSHARILSKSGNDYKVLSPLDGNIGWVSMQQIERTQYQDINTNKKCIP